MNKFVRLALIAALAGSAPVLAQEGPMGGPPPEGPRGPMPDPFGDATIAKADAMKIAEERFAQIDTDHNGTLSGDEQDAVLDTPAGRGLRRADTNADGKITRDEYMAGAGARFDMMDGDHDGQLTKAERDAFRAQMRERMRQGGWGGGPGGPGGPGGSGQ